MKVFLKNFFRFILFCFGPFLVILLAGYFYFDPFKVLTKYNDKDFCYDSLPHINMNRDYMSTELFLKNYSTYHYNSFIFGSSRSLSYKPETWKKYLKPDDSPYSFDAFSESINSICNKLKFLDARHVKIDNALVVICRDWSFRKGASTNDKHPLVSGENKLIFYGTCLLNYFNLKFLKAYYTYQLTHRYQDWMNEIFINVKLSNNPVTNQVDLVAFDEKIDTDPAKYYRDRKSVFYERTAERIDSVDRILPEHETMLKEIKRIFDKNKTDYHIVCSPLYEQIKYSPHDKKILTEVFGSRLYDFTGRNQFTIPVTNYYETSHYRKPVADSIFSIIYRKN